MFQSRKQDYFNWKEEQPEIWDDLPSFSPASRIILIERLAGVLAAVGVPLVGFSPASRIILIESGDHTLQRYTA